MTHDNHDHDTDAKIDRWHDGYFAHTEWKVYDCDKTYQAACKEPEAAAALAGFYGPGATIKHGHDVIVWREGSEGFPAGESYDRCAEVMQARKLAAYHAGYDRIHGAGAAAALLARRGAA
jgi:hypothetical protein